MTDLKTIQIHGKEYVTVAERLRYLAEEKPGGYSIETGYDYFPERKMWVVKATLTLGECLYTGLAQEIETDKGINQTSALENAETSAVGRACAMAGIGIIEGVASADEVNKALNRSEEYTQLVDGEKVIIRR